MTISGGRIYAGDVAGKVLVIDTETMEIREQLQVHRKNAKSIAVMGDAVATAGQDLSLAVLKANPLELLRARKKAHAKALILGTGISQKESKDRPGASVYPRRCHHAAVITEYSIL